MTMASWWLRLLFQLPAIRGVRDALDMGLPLQDCDAGELLALEELEAGTPAGRDVAEGGLVEPELAHRRGRVAAAHHGQAGHLGQRLGDGAGALGERRRLEDAHRAVPEDGLRVGERRR